MCRCAAINCNNKTINNREVLVHKDWGHATGHPVYKLPSKIESLRKCRTAIPKNKRSMIIVFRLSFFLAYFANFM